MQTTGADSRKSGRSGLFEYPTIGLSLDLSGVNADLARLEQELGPRVNRAIVAMQELESGGIANPDENRMVGHYWLRNPRLAPTPEIRREIEDALCRVESFAQKVRSGALRGESGQFKNFLLVGIGGSALGPQLAAHAFQDQATNGLKPHFLDNTDPDGMKRIINVIGNELGATLCIVISKSGRTTETQNGMLFLEQAFQRAGLMFERHAVAITMPGSRLHRYAKDRNWLETFPIWEWVGGRTSFFSAVTLLPVALMGVSIRELLAGAKACDEVTRRPKFTENPALLLAAAWYFLSEIEKKNSLAVIPYKDSLEYLARFLQQLVMESLGKERDLNGRVVQKGLVVFGNKGSTDQHSYVQQLRDGIDNTFTTFINVFSNKHDVMLNDSTTTAGDYLLGFSLGTKKALQERFRVSITLTLHDDKPFNVGAIIAIFERIVGFMASFLNINAYHQPGVEAGKLAAEDIVRIKVKVLEILRSARRVPLSSSELAERVGHGGSDQIVDSVCNYLAANGRFGIRKARFCGDYEDRYFSI